MLRRFMGTAVVLSIALTTVLAGHSHAICPVGDTIGSCPADGPTFEGCCLDTDSVQWCEAGDLCQLDCATESNNEVCTPSSTSCCQRCGEIGTCSCDSLCTSFGDCCTDYPNICEGDAPAPARPFCGWTPAEQLHFTTAFRRARCKPIRPA